MQFAVLVEQMRREGFEVLVSRPMVITKRINDVTCEPIRVRLRPGSLIPRGIDDAVCPA